MKLQFGLLDFGQGVDQPGQAACALQVMAGSVNKRVSNNGDTVFCCAAGLGGFPQPVPTCAASFVIA
jgi:hypothetical protein